MEKRLEHTSSPDPTALVPGSAWTEKSVRIYGLRVVVAVKEGSEDRFPLILFNGIGTSLEALKPFAERFPERTVVLFDPPGIGRSSVSWMPMSMGSYAQLAKRVLEDLGTPEADVAGVSWGGMLAQEFAIRYPEVTRKLVLMSTATTRVFGQGNSPEVASEMLWPRRYFDDEHRARIMPRLLGGEALTNRKIAAEFTKLSRRPTMAGYYSQMLAAQSWSWMFRPATIPGPLLVLAGSMDPIFPAPDPAALDRLSPGARLQVFESGHLLIHTKAQEVAQLIREFLDE